MVREWAVFNPSDLIALPYWVVLPYSSLQTVGSLVIQLMTALVSSFGELLMSLITGGMVSCIGAWTVDVT